MTTRTADKPGPAAPSSTDAPTHFLRRLARSIVLRAALRGRLAWPVALPLLARLEGGAR